MLSPLVRISRSVAAHVAIPGPSLGRRAGGGRRTQGPHSLFLRIPCLGAYICKDGISPRLGAAPPQVFAYTARRAWEPVPCTPPRVAMPARPRRRLISCYMHRGRSFVHSYLRRRAGTGTRKQPCSLWIATGIPPTPLAQTTRGCSPRANGEGPSTAMRRKKKGFAVQICNPGPGHRVMRATRMGGWALVGVK